MRATHSGNAALSIVAPQHFSLRTGQLEFPPKIET